jgi:SAM-dependent methyltransferase
MSHSVCPWWIGWLLVSPVRRLWQDPRAIVGPYLRPGMTVLEPGPGMGFFTLDLARLVGPEGRVVAVDVEPRMLEALRRRSARAGLLARIDTRLSRGASLSIDDLAGACDFVLAFAVVHELPDRAVFFSEAAGAMKPTGRLLLAEPRGHVSDGEFATTLVAAERAGLRQESRPAIRGSRAILLAPSADPRLASEGSGRAASAD